MIRHVWSVLCEQILTNPGNDNLSFINTMHEVLLDRKIKKGNPVNIGPFVIGTKWYKQSNNKEEIEIKISRSHCDNDEYSKIGETKIVFNRDTFAVALTMELLKFPVEKEGQYLIKVEYKPVKNKRWKEVALLPLRVTYKKAITVGD